jgi:hypothetical protein
MVLSTMPMFSVNCERKVRWVEVNCDRVASSMTALVSPSNNTGKTIKLRGGASPRLEVMRT